MCPETLQPDDLRRARRRRVVALALHEVGAVDPGRHDVDEHLARPGDRVGRRSPAQHLRPTGRFQRDRVHVREGSAVEHWPLRHLVLRTPRLELRPDDDAGLDELAPWRTAACTRRRRCRSASRGPTPIRRYLGRGILQYFWSERAALAPERWSVHFLVRLDGRVIGTQKLGARDFAITREVDTGSWIGLRHQGQGIGTEMRAAVVLFAFDHLGALTARSVGVRGQPARRSACPGGWATGATAPRPSPGAAVAPRTCGSSSRRRPSSVRRGRWRWTGTPRSAAPCSAGSAQVDAAGERVALRRVAGLVAGGEPLLALLRTSRG